MIITIVIIAVVLVLSVVLWAVNSPMTEDQERRFLLGLLSAETCRQLLTSPDPIRTFSGPIHDRLPRTASVVVPMPRDISETSALAGHAARVLALQIGPEKIITGRSWRGYDYDGLAVNYDDAGDDRVRLFVEYGFVS